ncbi:hypothetical protein STEG23_011712 [Scotinomys teguina]
MDPDTNTGEIKLQGPGLAQRVNQRYVCNMPLPWDFNFLALGRHKVLSSRASRFPSCKRQRINTWLPGLFLAGIKVQQPPDPHPETKCFGGSKAPVDPLNSIKT